MAAIYKSFSFIANQNLQGEFLDLSGASLGGAFDIGFTEISAGNYTLSLDITDYQRQNAAYLNVYVYGGNPTQFILSEADFRSLNNSLYDTTYPEHFPSPFESSSYDVDIVQVDKPLLVVQDTSLNTGEGQRGRRIFLGGRQVVRPENYDEVTDPAIVPDFQVFIEHIDGSDDFVNFVLGCFHGANFTNSNVSFAIQYDRSQGNLNTTKGYLRLAASVTGDAVLPGGANLSNGIPYSSCGIDMNHRAIFQAPFAGQFCFMNVHEDDGAMVTSGPPQASFCGFKTISGRATFRKGDQSADCDMQASAYYVADIKVVGAQQAAIPDTIGAILAALEDEVNKLKALLREHGLMAS